MRAEKRIDYIEIPVTDPAKARDFFAALMGWEFKDWGPDYISFRDGRLDGGFRRSEEPAPSNSVLLVFFSQDIFEFPGGRRFHFVDPLGNEYAIWGELEKN